MLTFLEFIAPEPLTDADLKAVIDAADKHFAELGMEVAFTNHFKERVNDARNGKQITAAELEKLFADEYRKHGKELKALSEDQEALLKDIHTNINLPFVIQYDRRTGLYAMVMKTVMRKRDFMNDSRPGQQVFKV